VSAVKEITILAVTKMHGGVCVAGIDSAGEWVRPVRIERKREAGGITDYCLLPLDFFHGGRSHLVCMGVTRVWLDRHQPSPPHSEDWTLDLDHKPQFIRKLSQQEQEDFLLSHAESDLSLLCERRSLGLFQAERFSFTFALNKTGDDIAVRAGFRVGREELSDVGCTDLRLRALGRKLMERHQGRTVSMTDADFRRRGKRATYLAVGLSRLYRGRHWPIVVGVHSLPEIDVVVDYANL
jgi:hypothetical protein